jgi:hypothetical protein
VSVDPARFGDAVFVALRELSDEAYTCVAELDVVGTPR